ncbi:MAG: type II secretion system F family protein [Deltaproteobacteria bacterium]|nr:type II secretion system F family protein [Deltaproteobacteria bacterium]
MDWVILGAIIITVTLFTYGFLTYWDSRRKLKERLKNPEKTLSTALRGRGEEESPAQKRFLELLSFSGQWALKDQQEVSRLRASLINAGYRHPNAPAIYFGLRVLTALLLPFPFLAYCVIQGKITTINLIIAFWFAGMGFFLPTYLLRVKIRKRQDRLDKALPDVLDLIIICMEAGLSLNGTLNRVAEEIRGIYKDFYNELLITTIEIRTGIPWHEALNNLGQRTGVQSVRSLVALMIQSDRLGASIAQALRTHADFVRVQRALRAEEQASKLAVKLLFPLICFIFPAMFIVILGPAVIRISKILLPTLGQ